MTEDRPRPQYGEYATPEQQATAAGQKFDPQAAARAVPPSHGATTPPPPDAATRFAAPEPGRRMVLVRHPVDRFFTIFMLGLGVFFLLTSIPSYLAFANTLETGYRQFGGGKFPEPDLANQVGIWMLVAHSVLFLLTVLWAVRRISRGRVASFVPIIGFVLFIAVFVVAFVVLFSAEPSYFQDVSNTISGTIG